MPPMGRGWEYVVTVGSRRQRAQWGEEAAEKLTAKPVEVGRYDLVLHPSNMWLTIHESIGHPTELDRALGYEANYAGTSFVSPPEDKLGQVPLRPELHEHPGRPLAGGRALDDRLRRRRRAARRFLIIKNGIVNDYQTTREQAPWLKWWYDKQGKPVRSHGCAYADYWSSVSFQRMPNVSLLPGEEGQKWEDLIAATDKGIAIIGDGSFSIDQQRYNAQFGGQVFYEIKGGKIAGMLKDVAYQIRTPDFWNSMDMIGGKASYKLGAQLLRRQRPAGPGRTREPRLRARAIPQHQHHQHREESMMSTARHGVERAADARGLSRERRRRSSKKVVKMSKADAIKVNNGGGYTNVRFAENQMSTAGGRRRERRGSELVRSEARRRDDQRLLRRGPRAHRAAGRGARETRAGRSGSDAGARCRRNTTREDVVRCDRESGTGRTRAKRRASRSSRGARRAM